MWEALDQLLRTTVRDTFTVGNPTTGTCITYTTRDGTVITTVPAYGTQAAGPLKGEYTPLYEDVSPADPAVPAAGPRLELLRSDLEAAGIAPREGDQVSFAIGGQVRTRRVIDVRDSDLGSYYLMLGDGEATP